MYQNKYLKYKNKYLQLKNLMGGAPIYKGLQLLGQGAENFAFLLPDGNTLRIRKDCETLGQNEITTITKMKDNTPLYFVKILAIGKCNDLRGRLKNDIVDFCDDKLLGDICNYTYIIMETAPGGNFLQYYGLQFKDLLNKPNFDELIVSADNQQKINAFVGFLFSFLNKIVDGLIDANTKLNGFIHKDFNYRNCNVVHSNGNPIIFDFGESKVGTIGDNSDILNYIKEILEDAQLQSNVYITVFPDYESKSPDEKILIKNNFYKLSKVLRAHPKINALITKYFVSAVTSYGGIRLSIGPSRESLETFKTKLNS
jgi:serine/threonine protein kinase